MSTIGRLKLLDPRPYEGQSLELIIGIDVGTTFSGVAYAFLRPGEIPEVQSVTRFTDQARSDKKVPSIMYYDEDDMLRAAGATAALDSVKEEAEFEGWLKVELFKMHMRPRNMTINTNGLRLGGLPTSKTIAEVMGDFVRYLFLQTMCFIEDHHADGADLLEEVSSRISFVLSHPNGWIGLPQQRMREAAILGGLIEDSPSGRDRIKFVAEGEASALSCLASGLCPSDLKPGYRFMIADAGGGTLDMTSYEVTQSKPLSLQELTPPDCRFAGSVFVNMEARRLLQDKLRGTHYVNPEILDDIITKDFEKETKPLFANALRPSWLRVGDYNTNDANLGIRGGNLRLEGQELAGCFQFSVDQALQSIRAQTAGCGGGAMAVWLVGGFGESPWLLMKLREGLRQEGIIVSTPNTNTSKAVAHGNVLFGLENTVTSRTTRKSYGLACHTRYRWYSFDHRRRQHLKYKELDGESRLPGKFEMIVKKKTEVHKDTKFTRRYFLHIEDRQNASLQIRIFSFDAENSVPVWYDENEDKFRHTFTVTANLENLCQESSLKTRSGKKFWTLNFDIEILLGLTELQARVKWVQDGKIKYGPAAIFYEE